MQVLVANGAWRHGSILSVRIGELRRQAPLQCDTCLSFPTPPEDVDHMQVDVFARVGSTTVNIEDSQELYDLNMHGEGFSSLALRVRPQDGGAVFDGGAAHSPAGSFGPRRRLEDAIAAGALIERHGLERVLEDASEMSSPPSSRAAAPQLRHTTAELVAAAMDSEATPVPHVPEGPPPSQPRPGSRRSLCSASEKSSAVAEERMERVRHTAQEYLQRHNLQQVLQDLFQQTIKEQPERPFRFIQGLLTKVDGEYVEEPRALPGTFDVRAPSPDTSMSMALHAPRQQVRAVEADAQEEARRMQQEQDYRDEIEAQRAEIQALRLQVKELQAAAGDYSQQLASLQAKVNDKEAGDNSPLAKETAEVVVRPRNFLHFSPSEASYASAAPSVAPERTEWQLQVEQRLLAKEAEIEALQRRHVEQRAVVNQVVALQALQSYQASSASVAAAAAPERSDLQRNFEDRLRAQEAEMHALQRQVRQQPAFDKARAPVEEVWTQERANLEQHYQQQMRSKQAQLDELQRRLQHYEAGRCTPGDAAAGIPKERSSPPPVELPTCSPPATGSTTAVCVSKQSSYHPGSRGLALDSTGSLNLSDTQQFAPTFGSEVNTHMLSQLLAATYAPPIAPTTYYEPQEDLEVGADGKPMVNVELLIEVDCCKDKTANGVYACVGECNSRPLYRLLGREPRYLYFAAIDPAWQGWWIADKMASHDYVEWFSNPPHANLPIYCKKGELGSRISEAPLTCDVAQKISSISSQTEKATIRNKLMEAFGSKFAKLDGTQRGLMSKTSPVVSVAHTLEAQQRALQLLHSQLALETQHRQAAEAHAQAMEDAFQSLHLRIQAHLPGGGGVAQLGSFPNVQDQGAPKAADAA